MNQKLCVMVTGLGGGGHGEQILKALRLARTEYEIVGGDMSPYSKGLSEVDHPYLLPPADTPKYIESVLAVCRMHRVKALFHGSEPELKAMSRERERIDDAGIFLPINPDRVIKICMDKFKTMKFLSDHGFAFPKTIRVVSREDTERIDFLPAVLKPSIGSGGSANVFLVQTFTELRAFCDYLLSIYSEFIAQEYVGTPETEYTVGVLISMDGELLNSIAVKKAILTSLSNRIKISNRSGNRKLGDVLAISSGVSQGEIGTFPEITKPCERLALALGCRGPVNIQCRFVDGKVFVFEINPRFSGTTSLRAMVGYNEPDILIRKHCLGEPVSPHLTYKSGYIVRGLQEAFIERIDFPKADDLL